MVHAFEDYLGHHVDEMVLVECDCLATLGQGLPTLAEVVQIVRDIEDAYKDNAIEEDLETWVEAPLLDGKPDTCLDVGR